MRFLGIVLYHGSREMKKEIDLMPAGAADSERDTQWLNGGVSDRVARRDIELVVLKSQETKRIILSCSIAS